MSDSTKTEVQGELKKVLGFWDTMGIALGQIIGSGIMVLTGICIEITGHGTPFAFIVAALLVIFPIVSLATIGSAVPATGGMYTYVRDYIGKRTGFFYLSLLVMGQIVLAMFAIGFADYACQLIPSVNHTLVALAILTICYIANMIGIKTAAVVQNFMIVALLAALSIFIAFGMIKVDFSVFTAPGAIMPNGFMAFMTGAALLTFATSGAEFISELGGEMKNPGRDMPRVMIISTLIVAVFYGFIGTVACGVLPIEQVAGKTLADVANAIFPKWLAVFFIIGGGMFAIATTLNATFSWCTKGLFVACQDGWLPKGLGAVNKRFGTPHILLTVFYIIGLVPILTGVSTRYIAMLGNGVSLIYVLFPIIACMLLPAKNPEAYEKAIFKLPRWAMVVCPALALMLQGFAAYLSIGDLDSTGWLLLASYCALVWIYIFFRSKKVNGLN